MPLRAVTLPEITRVQEAKATVAVTHVEAPEDSFVLFSPWQECWLVVRVYGGSAAAEYSLSKDCGGLTWPRSRSVGRQGPNRSIISVQHLGPLLASVVLCVPFGLAVFALSERWLGKRRNAAQHCAHCDGPLYAPGTRQGPSLLEGLQICGPCSTQSRHRLQRVLVLAAVLAILAVGGGIALALSEGGVWWAAPMAAGVEGALLYGGTLSVMKRLNRKRAAELAANGEIWPVVESGRGSSLRPG